jgi:hypothetical protein
MVRRPALATFNDDVARRIRFEREARKRGLAFSSRFAARPRRLIYRVPIVVPVYDESRTLTIAMGASAHPNARPPRVLSMGLSACVIASPTLAGCACGGATTQTMSAGCPTMGSLLL